MHVNENDAAKKKQVLVLENIITSSVFLNLLLFEKF